MPSHTEKFNEAKIRISYFVKLIHVFAFLNSVHIGVDDEKYTVQPFTTGVSIDGINMLYAAAIYPKTGSINPWVYVPIAKISNVSEYGDRDSVPMRHGFITRNPRFKTITCEFPNQEDFGDTAGNDQ